MKPIIDAALDEIRESASRIAAAEQAQLKVWRGEKVDRQPLLLHVSLSEEERKAYPQYTCRDMYEKSLYNLEAQIPAMVETVRGGAEAVPSARANMGCGIYASYFGLKQTLFDDKMPWLTTHLTKEELAEKAIDGLQPGTEFMAGLDHMALLAQTFEGTGARVFPMDLQGPVDLAHLLYSDSFFYDLYDDTGFICHLLELCVHSLIDGSNRCLEAIPGSNVSVPHYNEVVLPRSRGGIKTSEDTTTLLSGQHIREIAVPATSRVLKESGGGYIHYCGHNDHLLDAVLSDEHTLGLNFGNPDMHDMEDVIRRCAQVRKVFYGTVPRNPEEDWLPYFTRLLRASLSDGRKYLLLSVHCTQDEQSRVMDAWEKANVTADAVNV